MDLSVLLLSPAAVFQQLYLVLWKIYYSSSAFGMIAGFLGDQSFR